MFIEQLQAAVKANQSLLCVGLDPLLERLPASCRESAEPFFEFGKQIVDATHDHVCAYKPQIAYYAAESAEDQLSKTIEYIKTRYPQLPVILDAKRGDIGSTAEQYAREAFERFAADAVTLNPYMGFDAAEPFLARADKGVIFLCRTSNPGAEDFQQLDCGGTPLYQHVAKRIAEAWNSHGNCALVVGATAPSSLAEVRELVGDMPILVPGVGAQGGDLEAVLKAGLTASGEGLIINASRSIIYASTGDDFAAAAAAAASDLNHAINQHRR